MPFLTGFYSLSRIGAQVTGIDLSDKAIDAARELAIKAKTHTQFICTDLYSLPDVLDQKFDYVFTSYGTIGWLPHLNKLTKIIDHFLKPEGKFVMLNFIL